jgi:hypothetical protein
MTELQKRIARTRRVLAGRGLVEAISWSFIPRADAELFGGGQAELELANPISTEMSFMRPSLLAGLAAAARQNANRGFGDLALFEVGQIYRGDKPEDQLIAAAGIRIGTAKLSGSGRHWDGAAKPVDLFEAKADALALLSALGLDPSKVQLARAAPDWFHPGRSAVIRLGPKNILGTLSESIRSRAALDPGCSEPMLRMMAEAYLAGRDARTPLASPIFADCTGLPPLLVQVGTAEILYDDAADGAACARRAGVDVTFEPWEDMIHVWHAFAMLLPEGQQAIDRIGAYLAAHFAKGAA